MERPVAGKWRLAFVDTPEQRSLLRAIAELLFVVGWEQAGAA